MEGEDRESDQQKAMQVAEITGLPFAAAMRLVVRHGTVEGAVEAHLTPHAAADNASSAATEGNNGENRIDAIMARAKENSEKVLDSGRTMKDAPRKAAGNEKHATVTFFKDGFTCHEPPPPKEKKRQRGIVKSFKDISDESGGPLADLEETLRGTYEDPQYREFLQCMDRGHVPAHLRSIDPATSEPVPVSITVSDQRSMPMPQPTHKAPEKKSFGGQGQSLRPEAPREAVAAAPAPSFESVDVMVPVTIACVMAIYVWGAGGKPSWGAAAVATLIGLGARTAVANSASLMPRWKLTVDEDKPLTTLRVRMIQGEVLKQRFNTSHTIGDVYRWLQEEVAPPPRRESTLNFRLYDGHPPKALDPESDATLAEAQLLNALLTQRAF